MRIISGKFKGKKIFSPKDSKTRPLKDLTKESIFNILVHSKKIKINLENSNILDLFSGVGSFGIECLSRGVEKVTFIENYHGVLPILKKNLESLKTIKNFEIITQDINKGLNFYDLDKKFDLIFLDPPYKDKIIPKLIIDIYNKKILKKNGIIVIHRHKKEKDEFPEFISIVEKKNYGISKIIFLSYI
jgi:16S rRNA (guanine966-N2)-methyltransferase